MALVMTPIYTQVVPAGGVTAFSFNNIPQVYTDLKLVASTRRSTNAVDLAWTFNGDSGNNYSTTIFFAQGSAGLGTFRTSNISYMSAYQNGSGETANTFGSFEAIIPNYAGSNFKQVIIDSVAENAASTYIAGMNAGLYRSTNPIQSIQLLTANLAQHSTLSLYGIIRSGA